MSDYQSDSATDDEALIREIENGIFNLVITLVKMTNNREKVAVYLSRLADGLNVEQNANNNGENNK